MERLSLAIDELYDVGMSSISYVGQANYAEREQEAKQKFRDAYQRTLTALVAAKRVARVQS